MPAVVTARTCSMQTSLQDANHRLYVDRKASRFMPSNSATTIVCSLKPASMLGLTKLLQFRQHQWWEFRQYAFRRMGSQKISACQHMLPGAAVGRAQHARICFTLCQLVSSDAPNRAATAVLVSAKMTCMTAQPQMLSGRGADM